MGKPLGKNPPVPDALPDVLPDYRRAADRLSEAATILLAALGRTKVSRGTILPTAAFWRAVDVLEEAQSRYLLTK